MIRNIVSELNVEELDGKELKGKGQKYYRTKITIKSHWDNENWVILNLEKIEGKEITLNAKELNRAINNAIFWKVK